MIHPWWDAVAIGMEDAARQYEEMGVSINYEYLAPSEASAQDQVRRLSEASLRGFDVIGVDVADVGVVTPEINRLMESGQKVMTFSSSDAAKEDGCDRIAYVGNTHNYEDGADLTEALCQNLDYRGKIAVLVGVEGAPCHEERALGVRDVIAKYPEMEIVEIAYDGDSVDKAYGYAKEFLARHEDLAGIACCNMSNPVGAARAVIEAGREKEIVIVGMDHDQEALRYLRDGVIYALGVQDCYSIGFDTVQVAVKIADGHLPGEVYPEKTEEITVIIYQDSAAEMLQALYGEID
ncbi:sugar ABC transporter substrate-binding protein [Clostridiaceae bacterium]|nr:sugar ABC transporter substrate-binding protein [Clostridiaceae bacterium]RKI18488.1 sugar ABC transporter substrate-binding protein [bacterium 1XD21-70]